MKRYNFVMHLKQVLKKLECFQEITMYVSIFAEKKRERDKDHIKSTMS